MRILTEAEYERRMEQARMKGYEEAADKILRDRRDNDFREDIWRAVRESRQDFDRQIRALVIEMKKAGMEDPFEPKVACSCDGSCTPVNLTAEV
jgi:hypothetical protein